MPETFKQTVKASTYSKKIMVATKTKVKCTKGVSGLYYFSTLRQVTIAAPFKMLVPIGCSPRFSARQSSVRDHAVGVRGDREGQLAAPVRRHSPTPAGVRRRGSVDGGERRAGRGGGPASVSQCGLPGKSCCRGRPRGTRARSRRPPLTWRHREPQPILLPSRRRCR